MYRTTRERPTPHRYGCYVNGHLDRHGRRGFTCPRCAEHEQDEELRLLIRLDRLVRAEVQ